MNGGFYFSSPAFFARRLHKHSLVNQEENQQEKCTLAWAHFRTETKRVMISETIEFIKWRTSTNKETFSRKELTSDWAHSKTSSFLFLGFLNLNLPLQNMVLQNIQRRVSVYYIRLPLTSWGTNRFHIPRKKHMKHKLLHLKIIEQTFNSPSPFSKAFSPGKTTLLLSNWQTFH